MKFLCGRPGCGKESTATLQIDAPAEMVSLVDPRVSRDGVPLCSRHADATTPPMGWTMNDLRSRNRALAAVPDEIPSATPPRVRPDGEATPAAGTDGGNDGDQVGGQQLPSGRIVPRRSSVAAGDDGGRDFQFRNSRPVVGESAAAPDEAAARAATGKAGRNEPNEEDHGPDSRPARRREAAEQVEEPEERFPWHHQYEDDEPEEMQASSPLLSRAFRSSTG